MSNTWLPLWENFFYCSSYNRTSIFVVGLATSKFSVRKTVISNLCYSSTNYERRSCSLLCFKILSSDNRQCEEVDGRVYLTPVRPAPLQEVDGHFWLAPTPPPPHFSETLSKSCFTWWNIFRHIHMVLGQREAWILPLLLFLSVASSSHSRSAHQTKKNVS